MRCTAPRQDLPTPGIQQGQLPGAAVHPLDATARCRDDGCRAVEIAQSGLPLGTNVGFLDESMALPGPIGPPPGTPLGGQGRSRGNSGCMGCAGFLLFLLIVGIVALYIYTHRRGG